MRRLPILHVALVLLGAVAGPPTAPPAIAQTAASPQSTGTTMPSDIDPKSGMRLPLPKREELDEAGQKAYDRGTTPGATIAGLQGPSGIQLYSPKTAASAAALNRYLRFEAGFTPHVREVAILTTAREMDSQFEWVAHEPEALKEGVPQSTIDVIKYRRSTEGLDETDALIIELGRQLWRDHKVKSGNLRQAESHLRSEQAGRAGHADGKLCRHRRVAGGRRHATACREKAACCRSPRPIRRPCRMSPLRARRVRVCRCNHAAGMIEANAALHNEAVEQSV